MSDKQPPEVQKNGFRVLGDEMDIPEDEIEDYFTHDFDPNKPFIQNVKTFGDRFRQYQAVLSNMDEEELEELADEMAEEE